MKHLLTAVMMAVCVTLIGCTGQRKNNLEGSWRLVSRTQRTADTLFFDSQADYVAMMMIVNNRIAYFARHTAGGDTTYGYGEGTCELEGNDFTTNYEYHVDKTLIGQAVSWRIEVRGDTLIQIGPGRVGRNPGSQWESYQVWIRLK